MVVPRLSTHQRLIHHQLRGASAAESIVLMSGHPCPEDVLAVKEIGIREIIPKPTPMGQLTAPLDQLSRGPGKEGAAR